jgi:hypothetical protein
VLTGSGHSERVGCGRPLRERGFAGAGCVRDRDFSTAVAHGRAGAVAGRAGRERGQSTLPP